MKPKEYQLMTECIEKGVSYGYQRAFKYHDKPTVDEIVATISQYVMQEICENWTFDDEVKDD